MNTFWKDRRRRELVVAAVLGYLWALTGLTLAAHGGMSSPYATSSGSLSLVERGGERVEAGAGVALVPCLASTSFLTSPPAPLHQGEGSGGDLHEAASCRIRNHLAGGMANVGSGTLIDVDADRRTGLILSCAHLFTEGVGRVIVAFPDGLTHGANVVAVDRDADLSALEIASPPAAPVLVESVIEDAGPLTACGFGPAGEFRCIGGPIVGAVEQPGQVSLKMAGAVRSGDSGGGVFDARGRLVAVVWGESGGVTYASTGAPLRSFLQRVRTRGANNGRSVASSCPNGTCPLTGPRVLTPACPNGACPLLRPGVLGMTPGQPAGRSPAAGVGAISQPNAAGPCNCGCGEKLAAIDARIAALESGKQDRGDYIGSSDLAPYARADQLALVDQQNAERHKSLVDRLEKLGPLVAAAGRVVGPAATTALGVSGPIGWGILAATTVGGWLIGRWARRRGEERGRGGEGAGASGAAPARGPSSLAPPPEATAAAAGAFQRAATLALDTQQPIERDDREARELLRLSLLEGRDPLQDALAGRLALDRLDAVADGDADPQRSRWADDLRRELRDRFNEIAPTKFQVNAKVGVRNAE